MKIKKNDKVKVITGKHTDKKIGIVKSVDRKNNKIIVEGVRIAHKHVKPSAKSQGGIIKVERPIDVSNVMLVCPKCEKTTRVGYTFVETEGKKKKVRVCKKCNEQIDNI